MIGQELLQTRHQSVSQSPTPEIPRCLNSSTWSRNLSLNLSRHFSIFQLRIMHSDLEVLILIPTTKNRGEITTNTWLCLDILSIKPMDGISKSAQGSLGRFQHQPGMGKTYYWQHGPNTHCGCTAIDVFCHTNCVHVLLHYIYESHLNDCSMLLY